MLGRALGRWTLVATMLVTGAAACAQGGAGVDAGGGGPGTDGGTIVRRDGGPGFDGGGPGPEPCTDEGNSSICEMATDLGMLAAGDMATSGPSVLPATGDEDFFRVTFPPTSEPMMPGGGEPQIMLASNEDDQFRFEVRSDCSTTFACGSREGGARDIVEWSFTDDQAMEGEEQWTTRDVPWPDEVVIRVYRVVGAGNCAEYELQVTR